MRAWVLQGINWLPSITSLYQSDTTSCIFFFRYKIRRVYNDATWWGRETELQKLDIYGYCMDILCDDLKVSSRKGSDTKWNVPKSSCIGYKYRQKRERERVSATSPLIKTTPTKKLKVVLKIIPNSNFYPKFWPPSHLSKKSNNNKKNCLFFKKQNNVVLWPSFECVFVCLMVKNLPSNSAAWLPRCRRLRLVVPRPKVTNLQWPQRPHEQLPP